MKRESLPQSDVMGALDEGTAESDGALLHCWEVVTKGESVWWRWKRYYDGPRPLWEDSISAVLVVSEASSTHLPLHFTTGLDKQKQTALQMSVIGQFEKRIPVLPCPKTCMT